MMVLDNSHRITVTNLLTPNQSDGGDTNNPELLTLNQRTGTDALGDITGFTNYVSGTITSSTEKPHSGSRSVKCNNIVKRSGVATSPTTVTNGTVYVAGMWVYAENGANFRFYRLNSGGSSLGYTVFTGTGDWQWVEGVSTANDTEIILVIRSEDDATRTFYVDDLRLAKNDTNGFNAVNSATLSISPYTSYQGYRSLEVVTPGSVIGEGTYLPVTITGYTSYSESIKIKLPEGATVELTLHSDGGSKKNGFTNITGTGDWQEVILEDIEALSTDANFRIYIRTITSKQAITFYVDQSMLETGDKAHDWIIGKGSYSFFRSRE